MENVVYGYITLSTLATLGEEPYLDQLKILVAENRLDEKHIRAVAADVRKLIESRGATGCRRVDVPGRGSTRTPTSWGCCFWPCRLRRVRPRALRNPRRQPAERADGLPGPADRRDEGDRREQRSRSRGSISARRCFWESPRPSSLFRPARAGSRVFCRVHGRLSELRHHELRRARLGLSSGRRRRARRAASGGGVARSGRGAGIPVREALADFGVSQSTFGAGALDRALAGVGGTTRPVLLAIRNGFRRRARLALTVLTLSAGGVFFMAALNVRASLVRTLDRLFRTKKFDLSVSFGSMVSVREDRSRRASDAGHPPMGRLDHDGGSVTRHGRNVGRNRRRGGSPRRRERGRPARGGPQRR